MKVDEQFVFLVICVDGDPANAEGHAENDACALFNATCSFEGSDRLSSRDEKFEGIGAFVKGEDSLNGGLDDRCIFELKHSFQ